MPGIDEGQDETRPISISLVCVLEFFSLLIGLSSLLTFGAISFGRCRKIIASSGFTSQRYQLGINLSCGVVRLMVDVANQNSETFIRTFTRNGAHLGTIRAAN